MVTQKVETLQSKRLTSAVSTDCITSPVVTTYILAATSTHSYLTAPTVPEHHAATYDTGIEWGMVYHR